MAKNVNDADYMGLCHYRRFFLDENGEVRLPSDAIVIRNAYRKYKGYELNSAEKSVINEMYRFV